MKYHIRPMREEDLAQAALIEKKCFSSEAWSEKVYREEFLHVGSYLWLWCAVKEKEAPEDAARISGRGLSENPDSNTHVCTICQPEHTADPDNVRIERRAHIPGQPCREDIEDLEGAVTGLQGPFAGAESGTAELLGTISLTRVGEDGEIGNVAVLPEYRGKGIAGALLKTALEYGERGQGILSYTLEVRAGNAAAVHLYEKHGFRTQGRRPRFYTEPCEDALIMWKRDN